MKKIIHCDADCFFAAIEMRDDPSLRNRPLAVGGPHDARGVITTCNYEARRYGVRSAMASAVAKRLCPDLLIVPGNMNKYREASQHMREIFHSYTDKVEPLSLDEAYLDVSDCTSHCGSATLIAREIRQRIKIAIGINVSAGVAPNKFLAKIASDWKKPDALFVITPDQIDTFVAALPVEKIHGVGKVTAQKLKRLNISTCADVRSWTPARLSEHFGGFGLTLHQMAWGIDARQVVSSRRHKSLSVERTYEQDLISPQSCLEKIPELLMDLQKRLQPLEQRYRIAKGFVKVKFNDFSTTTLERAGSSARISDYHNMLSEAVMRREKPVRLLGLGVRFEDAQTNPLQLPLFAC